VRNATRWAALLLCAGAAAAAFPASGRFNPQAYLQHVKYLAGDELGGRGNGTPELDKAAEYIASKFRAGGLLPGAGDGTHFQAFALNTGSELGPGNKLTFRINGQASQAVVREDFIPIGMGDKMVLEGEVVFAGYGITAQEYGYDDYKGVDLTDKIALVLAHEPGENDRSSPFDGAAMTMHGEDNTKAINAKYRQARAILIAQDPANHPDADQDLANPAWGTQVDELGIAAFRISRRLAQKLVGAHGHDFLGLQKQIDDKMAPRSFPLPGVRVRIDLDVKQVRREVRNVVAMLPGTDAHVKDEAVVLGAHYDHLGRGGRSSMEPSLIGQIHNGADDNASGTAGLLELAAALARDPAPRKRSYVFIAFAGEELGLNGSSHWTGHSGRPLDKIVAMINMDMIGRMGNDQVLIGGLGTSPLFPKLVGSAAAAVGLTVKSSPSGYGSSDHQSFYLKDIPVLFFFSGLHADYHRPSDDWDKINAEGATKILDMVYSIATELNGLGTRPQFTKVNEPTQPPVGGGSGYGAYFGSVPDMTDEVSGVRFSDVRPNSPAAKAGLQGQDVLVRFAGKEIKNLQDFTYMLRTHKPGETVEIVVLRDGKPLTVQVTLESRR